MGFHLDIKFGFGNRKSAADSSARSYSDEVLADKLREIGALSSGIAVTGDNALKFSAVWAAVRLLSEIPASLPKLIVERKPDGKLIHIDNEPASFLLDEPNSYMTGFDFHELMNRWLQLRGNAVAVIRRDRNGFPTSVIPVNWDSVRVKISGENVIYTINDNTFGIKGQFFSDDVLHYKLFSGNGIVGSSPIAMAKKNIGLALAAENYGAEFFERGGNHKAVIEVDTNTPGWFKSYKEYEEWKSKYDSEHGRANQTVPVLQPGMKFHQLTMSMEDAQFIATRQFQINDIARWYNIPPHLIGDLSRATFTNIEHQDLQFIKYTLRGVIKRQEKEWERKMFSPERRRVVGVKFNIDGLARGDMSARSGYMVSLVNAGIITPDEARAIEGMSPLGADELRIPANIVGNNNSNSK